MQANMKLKVNAIIESIHLPTGEVTKTSKVHNLVVDTGIDEFIDTGMSTFDFMAIGTGVTAPAAGNTTLQTEFVREAVTPTDEGNGIRLFDHTFTFGSGVSETITEFGIFDLGAAGIMLNRLTDAGHDVDIDNGVRVRITFTLVAV